MGSIFLSSTSPPLTQVLSEEVSGRKSGLDDTVEAGRDLEAYTDAEPASLPDIGYTDLWKRYNDIKVTLLAVCSPKFEHRSDVLDE